MKYVVLLRGINVGGNNKVSMTELKTILTDAGFANVRTYINSGNVLLESSETDERKLEVQCELAIEKSFGFPVGCVVIASDRYKQIVKSAPKWWGNSDENMRSDALFVLRTGTPQAVIDAVGPVDNDFEWLESGDGIVFWTIDRRRYTRTRLPKIIGTDVYRTVSMRSSTTSRKLLTLLEAE